MARKEFPNVEQLFWGNSKTQNFVHVSVGHGHVFKCLKEKTEVSLLQRVFGGQYIHFPMPVHVLAKQPH